MTIARWETGNRLNGARGVELTETRKGFIVWETGPNCMWFREPMFRSNDERTALLAFGNLTARLQREAERGTR